LNVDLEGAQWRKSSYSGGSGGNCVEVAAGLSGGVAVRDSNDPEGVTLFFMQAEWRAFTGGMRAGEFDLPRPR
jgi:hypothetical protein